MKKVKLNWNTVDINKQGVLVKKSAYTPFGLLKIELRKFDDISIYALCHDNKLIEVSLTHDALDNYANKWIEESINFFIPSEPIKRGPGILG